MNSVTRWEPFRNLASLQEQVNRLFEGNLPHHRDQSTLTAWSPSVDVYETEKDLVIKPHLPAVAATDIDVRLENNMLTIRGERKLEQKVKEENYLRMERSYGCFTRSFSLPNTVNTEQIQAQYNDGVLTVTLPKRAESKPKQVKINVSNGKNGQN